MGNNAAGQQKQIYISEEVLEVLSMPAVLSPFNHLLMTTCDGSFPKGTCNERYTENVICLSVVSIPNMEQRKVRSLALHACFKH